VPPTLDERVAVLESRMDRDDEDRAERRRELDSHLASIKLALESSAREMARYKGVIGGVSLAISILWAGIALLKEFFTDWLHR
jgi:hypothetical protein